jgi:hypothetical protein
MFGIIPFVLRKSFEIELFMRKSSFFILLEKVLDVSTPSIVGKLENYEYLMGLLPIRDYWVMGMTWSYIWCQRLEKQVDVSSLISWYL